MVYRLTVAYRGTSYCGWQRQTNAVSVQECLEEALARALGVDVPVVGAGRTDAGVHARGQTAHLALGGADCRRRLVHGTNHFLPEDIRVLEASVVPDDFHARKSALAKVYSYRTVRARVLSPMEGWRALAVAEDLDVAAMRAATSRLVGEHDFTAFALSGGSHASPVRRVFEARWLERGAALELSIVGDGFLRGMVRSVVGTLLEVGRGRMEPGVLDRLLGGAPRGEAGPTAPPQALVLDRVVYRGDVDRLW